MSDINVPKQHDGYIYTITSVKVNSSRKCPSTCYRLRHDDECYHANDFRHAGIVLNKGEFLCVEIVVNVKNVGNHKDWVIGSEDIKMIDNEGYVYEGYVPNCDEFKQPRLSVSGTVLEPGTQTNYIEFFPILPEGLRIHSFIVDIHHKKFKVNLSDEPIEIEELCAQLDDINNAEDDNIQDRQYEINQAKYSINRIKTLIYERMNNILTTTEKTKLENRINTEFFSLLLEIESKGSPAFTSLVDEVKQLQQQYQQQLRSIRDGEKGRIDLAKKIEECQSLTPQEFEEYVGQLFEALGYAVEVTPLVNDKGTDIIMYKDGVKYVVQCKRYKGTVGSPEIQTFLGSMTHYNADKGYFVTTGMFSFEAEKIAAQHPIILFNKIDLAKLITEALGCKG